MFVALRLVILLFILLEFELICLNCWLCIWMLSCICWLRCRLWFLYFGCSDWLLTARALFVDTDVVWFVSFCFALWFG